MKMHKLSNVPIDPDWWLDHLKLKNTTTFKWVNLTCLSTTGSFLQQHIFWKTMLTSEEDSKLFRVTDIKSKCVIRSCGIDHLFETLILKCKRMFWSCYPVGLTGLATKDVFSWTTLGYKVLRKPPDICWGILGPQNKKERLWQGLNLY